MTTAFVVMTTTCSKRKGVRKSRRETSEKRAREEKERERGKEKRCKINRENTTHRKSKRHETQSNESER